MGIEIDVRCNRCTWHSIVRNVRFDLSDLRKRLHEQGWTTANGNQTFCMECQSASPREGIDRCACGCKYWDGNRCHSCKEIFQPDAT